MRVFLDIVRADGQFSVDSAELQILGRQIQPFRYHTAIAVFFRNWITDGHRMNGGASVARAMLSHCRSLVEV
jgi:hypothetical protein